MARVSDLRAAVEGLPHVALTRSDDLAHTAILVDAADVLALIPEGAVLVTEETLARALEAHFADPMAPHPGRAACSPDILRHLRETP